MSNLFFNLMEATGNILKVGELEVFENNQARYATEDSLLTIEYIEETEQVLMYSFIAELPLTAPDSTLKALYEALLEGQTFFVETAGASLTINKQTTSIFLQIIMPMQTLKAENMLKIFDNLMDVAKYWEMRCDEIIKKTPQEQKNSEENATRGGKYVNENLLKA